MKKFDKFATANRFMNFCNLKTQCVCDGMGDFIPPLPHQFVR